MTNLSLPQGVQASAWDGDLREKSRRVYQWFIASVIASRMGCQTCAPEQQPQRTRNRYDFHRNVSYSVVLLLIYRYIFRITNKEFDIVKEGNR